MVVRAVVMQTLEDEGIVDNGTAVDLDRWWFIIAAGDKRAPSTKVKGSFYQPSRSRVSPFSESLIVVE